MAVVALNMTSAHDCNKGGVVVVAVVAQKTRELSPHIWSEGGGGGHGCLE